MAEEATTRKDLALALPVVGQVNLPPAPQLAWYAGMALLTALEVVDWPVALLLMAGRALADNRHSAALRDFGSALEDAS